MNKWVMFGLGVLAGVVVAPKLRALIPIKLPSIG